MWFELCTSGTLLTMVRSDTSSRTTYPQGFMLTGLLVSNDQPWPPGPGAGFVLARKGIGTGWLDGVEMVLGSVERLHAPKCRSSAMKVPVIVVLWSKSLQS